MKRLLLSLVALIAVKMAAQQVTDEQYYAANAAIEAEATYHIFTLHDSSGRLQRTFRACDGTSVTSLPHGLYIVTWELNGRRRTVKFSTLH